MSITQEWLTIPTVDGPMRVFVAKPQGPGPFPAVLVIQEIFGVTENFQALTLRLAAEGVLAAAPELFHRRAQTTFNLAQLQDAMAAASGLSEQDLLMDLDATAQALLGRADVKPGRLGIMGFCFGGRVAYLAAVSRSHFAAVASFYGSRIAGTPLLEQSAAITARMELFFGGSDPWIPVEQPLAIRSKLAELGKDARVHIYDQAGHGFVNRPEESAASAAAAEDAWRRTVQLFQTTL